MITFQSDAKLPPVAGRGGGKGGGKGGDQTQPNTYRSNARARLIEAISEGPIHGLVDGARSIFFEQTPLQNEDGSYNFKDVRWIEHKGSADEGYFNGHTAVETPFSVETQVKKATGAVQRTIVDENADAVRVIVRVPALTKQDDKGLKRTDLHYEIDVRANNGSWTTAVSNSLRNEKAMSPFQIAHRIDLPANGSPWDVRVRRVTDDSADDKLQNDLYWEGYVVLVEGKFTYPFTAAVGMELNAEEFGTNIAPRAFHVKGLLVHVPSNYDPIARTYTGIWNGTFKIAWTNNPAWVFYDLLVNNRYGLGEFISPEIVDKWSLYTIAQYCDQMVPSGYKNGDTGTDIYEPRFTYNGVINTRDEAFFVLQSITQAWRGMAYWALGKVFATADMPADPVRLVTPSNVIGGEFDYSGTALKARHTVVQVKWNDPDDFYRPSTEIVIDTQLLHKHGWREKSVQLRGCTSRGLAHRYGKWIIDSEQHETETLTYSASWDHAELRPGDIIAVSDPRKAMIRAGGRLVDYKNLVATLDAPFDFNEGEIYRLILTMPDGQLETRDILAFLDDQTVRIASEFTKEPKPDAIWTITGTDIAPRQYRVLSIDESEPNVFKVTSLAHDPMKFARIEHGITFEPLPYSRPSKASLPPANLRVTEEGYVSNGQTFTTLTVSWSPPQNFLARGYVVTVDTPEDGRVQLGTTANAFFEMRNTGAGEYTFYVQTVSYQGVLSEPAAITFQANGPTGFTLPTVTDLQLVDRPESDEFIGRDVAIRWQNKFARVLGAEPTNEASPHYMFNVVKIFVAETNELLREERVSGESYIYPYLANRADNARIGRNFASRRLRIEVTVSDIFGRTSLPASRVFLNAPPAAIAPSYAVLGSTIFLNWAEVTDDDFAGVILHRSKTPGIDVDTGAPYYTGMTNSLTIPGNEENTTYYFRLAAYDGFGKDALNWSSEFSIMALQNGGDFEPPEVPDGLELTSHIETVAGVIQRQVLVALLDDATDEDFIYFDYRIKQNGGNWVSFASSSPRHEWTVLPEQTYTVVARAVDKAGNTSGWCEEVVHTTPACPELAHLINGGSVAIEGGKIKIQGETMLSDWRRAGDLTKIDGGAVSANTIEANKLTIGNRGVQTEGLEFEHNTPATNQLTWSGGAIRFIGDDGNVHARSIVGGTAQWTTGVLYVYWVKNAEELSFSTNPTLAFAAHCVVLAAYRGGRDLNVEYGRTIIDGSAIKTGTIETDQLKAGAVTATTMSVTSLSSISGNMGVLVAGRAQSVDGKFVIDLTNKFISIEV